MRRAERMARVGERRDAYRDLVGKPEERRSLLTFRSRWEDDISMDRKEKEWKVMDWICSDKVQKRFFPKLSYSKFYMICSVYY
jgi:hypothetical protein